jgi:uncharacterized 2Fe-2S/4Fe-4S cluster protein (DUF4445 family)
MPTVHFRTAGPAAGAAGLPFPATGPQAASVQVPEGTTLLEASRRAGLAVEAPCNGGGTCGKCRVRIDAPGRVRGAAGDDPHRPLACQAQVLGDLGVELPEAVAGLRILSQGAEARVALAPHIRKVWDPAAGLTRVYAGTELLDQEPGDTTGACFGLVVDIGTTTLVAALVDLRDGRERLTRSALNPQTRHGQDVLSRIQLGSTPEGLELLRGELIRELNRLVASLCQGAGVAAARIHEAVLSGNTAMLHLAVGADPRSLGRSPYTPVLRGGEQLEAAALGLAIAPRGRVYLPPLLSAYVGADIVSGLLATDLHRQPGVVLFVDIGTNGEMVLAVDGELTATSTAAGPAFEGMNIACGMRAALGAVEGFALEPRTAMDAADAMDAMDAPAPMGLRLDTIGGAAPVGLCGSGLLDLVGELARWGSLDRNGRFSRRPPQPALAERLELPEGRPQFRVAGPVFLTQRDVRQVQLAKGAVRAGIELLLLARGLRAEAVDRVLIAGSFGFHLRTASLVHLGLLPAAFADRVSFVGNTSQSGGRAFLVNAPSRDAMAQVAARVRVLELANDPAFEATFIAALAFPEPHPAQAPQDRPVAVQGR